MTGRWSLYMLKIGFSVSRLQRPALRVISHFGYTAENMPLRQTVLCLSELNGRFRFSIVQTPAANSSDLSCPSCAAKNAASEVHLKTVGAKRLLSLFLMKSRFFAFFCV